MRIFRKKFAPCDCTVEDLRQARDVLIEDIGMREEATKGEIRAAVAVRKKRLAIEDAAA